MPKTATWDYVKGLAGRAAKPWTFAFAVTAWLAMNTMCFVAASNNARGLRRILASDSVLHFPLLAPGNVRKWRRRSSALD